MYYILKRFKKNNMNKYNILFTIIMILFGVALFLFNKYINSNESINESRKEREFRGIIIRKYRDYDNHGSGFLVLKDSTKYCPLPSDIYYKVKIGDSLIKEKNNLKLIIYRKDSVFSFDLEQK